jgi:hypothetical protein
MKCKNYSNLVFLCFEILFSNFIHRELCSNTFFTSDALF